MRRNLGVDLEDRIPLARIYEECEIPSLDIIIAQRVTRWVGHVMRMEESRYPRLAFECTVLGGDGTIGRQWTTGLRHYYKHLWTLTGFVVPAEYQGASRDFTASHWEEMWSDLFARAQDRSAWRTAVQSLPIERPMPEPTPPRRNARRAVRGPPMAGGVAFTT